LGRTHREERLERVMDIKPIDEESVEETTIMPAVTTDLTDLDVNDLEGEVAVLYGLSKSAIEIKDTAIGELDDCMDQTEKASLISSATSALTASINAIDKATRIKMTLIKLKGLKKREEKNVYDRNELLRMMKEVSEGGGSTEES